MLPDLLAKLDHLSYFGFFGANGSAIFGRWFCLAFSAAILLNDLRRVPLIEVVMRWLIISFGLVIFSGVNIDCCSGFSCCVFGSG